MLAILPILRCSASIGTKTKLADYMIIYVQTIFRSALESQEFESIYNKLLMSLYRLRAAKSMKDPALLFKESMTKGAKI
jgi:hypothetical protein